MRSVEDIKSEISELRSESVKIELEALSTPESFGDYSDEISEMLIEINEQIEVLYEELGELEEI